MVQCSCGFKLKLLLHFSRTCIFIQLLPMPVLPLPLLTVFLWANSSVNHSHMNHSLRSCFRDPVFIKKKKILSLICLVRTHRISLSIQTVLLEFWPIFIECMHQVLENCPLIFFNLIIYLFYCVFQSWTWYISLHYLYLLSLSCSITFSEDMLYSLP